MLALAPMPPLSALSSRQGDAASSGCAASCCCVPNAPSAARCTPAMTLHTAQQRKPRPSRRRPCPCGLCFWGGEGWLGPSWWVVCHRQTRSVAGSAAEARQPSHRDLETTRPSPPSPPSLSLSRPGPIAREFTTYTTPRAEFLPTFQKPVPVPALLLRTVPWLLVIRRRPARPDLPTSLRAEK